MLADPTSDARPFQTNAAAEYNYLEFMKSIEVSHRCLKSPPGKILDIWPVSRGRIDFSQISEVNCDC